MKQFKTDEMAVAFGKVSKQTKVDRYSWSIRDYPGKYQEINKNIINIEAKYQRDIAPSKIKKIARNWSWIACSALTVAMRMDGTYWAVDGQHRLIAAMKRSDIQKLPCIVFPVEYIKEEAQGFIDINIGRKPVSSVESFYAAIIAGDEVAIYVDNILRSYGISVKKSTMKVPKTLKCVHCLMQYAQWDKESFEAVIETINDLCENTNIVQILIEGLFYIHKNCTKNLLDPYLKKRLIKIGSAELVHNSKQAAGYFGKGGAKIYADGMLNRINKGIKNKIKFK